MLITGLIARIAPRRAPADGFPTLRATAPRRAPSWRPKPRVMRAAAEEASMSRARRENGSSGTWLLLASLLLCSSASAAPAIQWFRAFPSTVETGGSTVLRWHVDAADSVSIQPGPGAVAASGFLNVSPATTTTYTLTATSTSGVATREEIVVVGPNPPQRGGRYVRLVAPAGGQRFTAPATLRVFAAAYDPTGGGGNERNAASVAFYVDDQLLAQVPAAQSEYWVFKATLPAIGAGRHRVWARATYASPAATLDSESWWIEVENAPTPAQVVTLTQDVVLSGTQDYVLAGSPGARVRLEGNGHRIRSAANWSGEFALRHVDVVGLGPVGSPTPAIEIATPDAVTIEDSVFDTSGTVSLTLGTNAAAAILRNEFRSNMTMPEAQQPEFGSDASYPALRIRGGGDDALKRLQGNRVGVGWIDVGNTSRWLIGGDTDAESNVVIGARAGIWVRNTSQVVMRGNLVYHVYFGGWSQGNVVELDGSDDIVVEHNLIGGGSWPIRGFGGTLRYNLVLDAGHEWLWVTGDGAHVHHNVFVGGDGDQSPIRVIYGPQQVRIHNNTLDGLGASSMLRPVWVQDEGSIDLRSNAIVGMPNTPGVQIDGTLEADYNLFHGRAGAGRNYSDQRWPPHDVGSADAQTDPRFAEASEPFRYRWDELWSREIGVRRVLADYRQRYTPGAGSPLTDAGDPTGTTPHTLLRSGFEDGEGQATGGAGNDIGAVGSGDAAPDDRFGR
jgi:hypothetical protein